MKKNILYLVANGDLRASANQKCEKEQLAMEAKLISALHVLGYTVKRAHGYRSDVKHSFIDSQKYGIQVFSKIPQDAPVIVAEAVWQYSHHILPGLLTHTGPILTLANWSGVWPGLVGMLNLNGSLLKAGVKFSSLWSEDFTDEKFKNGLVAWLKKGEVKHATPHVKSLSRPLVGADASVGRRFAQDFRSKKAIMGVFDEGCMGMYNAIIPDEIIHPTGVYKERLSQSSLYAEMLTVKDAEAQKALNWLLKKGMKFAWGKNEKTELTKAQTIAQLKMYIAAVRIADDFGCATIGIQYQQGLKDLAPASDLVEGLLNNRERPPVLDRANKRELFKGEALPHFNEVDECAGLDGLITYHLWKKLGFEPENTLHDLRWGRQYVGPSGKKMIDEYVWVFLISGAAPVQHFIGGYKGTVSERQPAMYFRLGGGTVKGVSKPGWIVWSRIFVRDNELHADLGIAEVIALPQAETEDRWQKSTPQWPIMHTVLSGISRDEMMARHPSNHIQVVYTPSPAGAKRGLLAKAAAFQELGIKVSLCGKY
ncbi:MAG: fucose isomerase [Opitutales bacterium]|nr:fucose isomerase [Opitutales bacterium]